MREDIYYPDYMETHDIDWFCRIGAISIHCASNGGVLPKKVNVRSVNRKIQETVAAMPEVLDEHEEVIVNERYVRERLENHFSEEAYAQYISSFVAMARKGFWSFDRELNESHNDVYMWIAKPARYVEIEINTLPEYNERQCRAFLYGKEELHVSCLDSAID